MKSALVVVSHYNAWPTTRLIALLDQMATVPAGHPFRCRVVVNQAEPKPLELPERLAHVEVLYRPNTGYNIGAWDLGWRQGPPADLYLFVQEECQLLRPGWLKAFVDRLRDPKVGLVGESLAYRGWSWRRADHFFDHIVHPRQPDAEGSVLLMDAKREVLAMRNIAPTRDVGHLQSLVLATRRDVLEAIDGFGIYNSYAWAVGAEFAISKQVESLGLRIRQLGFRPFRYILHPQWLWLTPLRPTLFRRIERHLPYPVAGYFRRNPRWYRGIPGRCKRFVLDRVRPAAQP